MGAYDSNDVAIANHQHLVIDGVPPAPAPFDGQFFQLDVESITPRRVIDDGVSVVRWFLVRRGAGA